ncbi:hypothetical protein M569_02822, partial [Genlisea aurea]
SSEDSDTDSMSEDESETKAQVEALEASLHGNPFDYDSHVQYIKLLRKQGDVEKLTLARESMSSVFPLSPEMWLEWAKDEVTIRPRGEVLVAVEKLYERGVADYLSVSLWCDYLNFIQEYDPSVRDCSSAGISKARNLFERALTAGGLHIPEGHKIWDLYREFEQAIFLDILEKDPQAQEKQRLRIRNLFHRQLSVPLAEIEATYQVYKVWEVEDGGLADGNGSSNDVFPGYQKALKMLNARIDFEEKISKEDSDSEKLLAFLAYLKFEHSFGDPARLQILYERAIEKFPVSADLWAEYTLYLDKTFKTARIVRETYYRATRNCYWVGELWVRYLLSLERSRCSEEELSSVFERALACTSSSFDEYLNIVLTRVDGLRRRISTSVQTEDGISYTLIRDILQRASDYLAPHLKNSESFLHLQSYWSRLEIKLGKDLTAARGVWESLLKISGSILEAWQGYIAMEIETGNIDEARSLYKRCYSKRFPGTGSEDICHSWVRFEREYGSLENFDIAVQKVTPRLQELQLFKSQQESKNAAAPKSESREISKKVVPEKRKPTLDSSGGEMVSKRQKTTSGKLKKIGDNVKAQTMVSAEASDSHGADSSKTAGGSAERIPNPSSRTCATFDDQCTAFISNLNFRTSEKDLRSFFADVGGVVDIRILKDKFTNRPRGLAYIDFSDDEHLGAALEKNKQCLLGKKLSVLKSVPQRGGSKKKRDDDEGEKSKDDEQRRRSKGGEVELKGKVTFAVPRSVKPQLRSSSSQVMNPAAISNEEFRKMFLK